MLLSAWDVAVQHVSLLPWGFSVYSNVIKTTVCFQGFLHSLEENQMVHGWETDRYFTDLADFTDFLEGNQVVNSLDLMFSFFLSHNHNSCELSVSFCQYFQLGFGENYAPVEQKHCSSFVYPFICSLCPSFSYLLAGDWVLSWDIYFFILFVLFYLLRLSNLYYSDDNGSKVGSLFTDQLR